MLKLVALLGAAALLAGCVAVPDDGYGYGYAQPYYPGGYAYGPGYAPVYGTVNVWGGDGWRDRDHWRGGDDRWHGGWRGGATGATATIGMAGAATAGKAAEGRPAAATSAAATIGRMVAATAAADDTDRHEPRICNELYRRYDAARTVAPHRHAVHRDDGGRFV